MKKYKMTFDNLRDVLRVLDCQGYDVCPLKGKAARAESCYAYCQAHPEEAIALIGLEVVEVEDKPRLTEQELAICKAVGAKWVSWDKFHIPELRNGIVDLWECSPHYNGAQYSGTGLLAKVGIELFPSLNPGDCVNVEELLESSEQ